MIFKKYYCLLFYEQLDIIYFRLLKFIYFLCRTEFIMCYNDEDFSQNTKFEPNKFVYIKGKTENFIFALC